MIQPSRQFYRFFDPAYAGSVRKHFAGTEIVELLKSGGAVVLRSVGGMEHMPARR